MAPVSNKVTDQQLAKAGEIVAILAPVTIDFAGLQGSGKTILSNFVCEALLAAGLDVEVAEEAELSDQLVVSSTQFQRYQIRVITDKGIEINNPFVMRVAPPAPTADKILTDTAKLISGDRANQHGDKRENHQNIADLFNAYLGIRAANYRDEAGKPFQEDVSGAPAPFRRNGRLLKALDATDIALLIDLLKTARTKSGSYNPDDYLDKVGYSGIAAELAHKDRGG